MSERKSLWDAYWDTVKKGGITRYGDKDPFTAWWDTVMAGGITKTGKNYKKSPPGEEWAITPDDAQLLQYAVPILFGLAMFALAEQPMVVAGIAQGAGEIVKGIGEVVPG